MCKRLRDCAIPECVRTVIPFQYLLRSNISGMSPSLRERQGHSTLFTRCAECVEGQQSSVSGKIHTAKCVQWKSVSRSMSMYLSPFVYNFFLIKFKNKDKKQQKKNTSPQHSSLPKRRFQATWLLQFSLYPVSERTASGISVHQLAVEMKSSPCKIIHAMEMNKQFEEKKMCFFQCLEDAALHKQGLYLGTSVTFGVAMYNEIYNHDTLGW